MARASLLVSPTRNGSWLGAALLACCSLLACDDEAVPSAPTVSTDVSALRRLVALPKGIVSARWLVQPRGLPGSRLVPGPTDTLLYAYLETEPGFWVEQGFRAPALNTGSIPRLEAEVARSLLPAAVLNAATLKGDSYQLKCEPRAPAMFGGTLQPCRVAVRCGDGLLLMFEGN